MWNVLTSRHFDRSTVVPNVCARSSMTFQWWASASKPSAERVAPMESSPTPCFPASRGPVGEATAATATSKSEYGARCRRASTRLWVLVCAVTASPRRSRMMMSRFTSSSSRVSVGLSPIIAESVGSEPGPRPNITRPRVRWSSSTMRSAAHSGLW